MDFKETNIQEHGGRIIPKSKPADTLNPFLPKREQQDLSVLSVFKRVESLEGVLGLNVMFS